jgi:hypothetical protein
MMLRMTMLAIVELSAIVYRAVGMIRASSHIGNRDVQAPDFAITPAQRSVY